MFLKLESVSGLFPPAAATGCDRKDYFKSSFTRETFRGFTASPLHCCSENAIACHCSVLQCEISMKVLWKKPGGPKTAKITCFSTSIVTVDRSLVQYVKAAHIYVPHIFANIRQSAARSFDLFFLALSCLNCVFSFYYVYLWKIWSRRNFHHSSLKQGQKKEVGLFYLKKEAVAQSHVWSTSLCN